MSLLKTLDCLSQASTNQAMINLMINLDIQESPGTSDRTDNLPFYSLKMLV
jgi:hypothetical protein